MAKFVTDASGATWWPNLEPMQVAFFLLAEEITQVKEAIPWVRCASGNVFFLNDGFPYNLGPYFDILIPSGNNFSKPWFDDTNIPSQFCQSSR